MVFRIRTAARRLVARVGRVFLGGVDDRLENVERRLGRLDKKIDALRRQVADDGLLLRRLDTVAGRPALRSRAKTHEGSTSERPGVVTGSCVSPAAEDPRDWWTLVACPVCRHDQTSLVCEYNRFIVWPQAGAHDHSRRALTSGGRDRIS